MYACHTTPTLEKHHQCSILLTEPAYYHGSITFLLLCTLECFITTLNTYKNSVFGFVFTLGRCRQKLSDIGGCCIAPVHEHNVPPTKVQD